MYLDWFQMKAHQSEIYLKFNDCFRLTHIFAQSQVLNQNIGDLVEPLEFDFHAVAIGYVANLVVYPLISIDVVEVLSLGGIFCCRN